jgi:GntR family transcriptional repressor for pyruvate dehydrogenase complex
MCGRSVWLSVDTTAERGTYLQRIQHEPARIVAGFAHREAAEVRRTMREHLTRSLGRDRNWQRERKNGRR